MTETSLKKPVASSHGTETSLKNPVVSSQNGETSLKKPSAEDSEIRHLNALTRNLGVDIRPDV